MERFSNFHFDPFLNFSHDLHYYDLVMFRVDPLEFNEFVQPVKLPEPFAQPQGKTMTKLLQPIKNRSFVSTLTPQGHFGSSGGG